MRRLDVAPLKKLRGRARYERAFRRNMRRVADWFPDQAEWAGPYSNWKLPVYDKVISTRHGSPAFRREVVQTLVQTAAQVATNKPEGADHARVAAIVSWPDLFSSEICVFFDRTYEQRFDPATQHEHGRHTYDGGWVETREPDEDLFAAQGITLPDGFTAGGIATTEYDADFDETYCHETWVAMEPLKGIAP